jgi:ParB family transcriptional regulator, chromosome partitioning protein
MTTAAEKKDEKVEKRRALGRGLDSLLPGPRAVSSTQYPVPSTQASPHATKNATIPVPEPEASEVQQPAGSEEMEIKRAGAPAPHGPTTPPSSLAILSPQQDAAFAAGQPGAAVHTSASPADEPEFGEYQPGEVISIQAVAEEREKASVISQLRISSIDKNPYQTRFVFDDEMLQELQDSIRQHGVVQPIVVRPAEVEGRYILVLGERRLRASKLAGKTTIPAMVRRLSQQQAAEMTVLENVVREDLNPIEQANAFKVLSIDFKLTQSQIAQRIGVSRESVTNYMRLLRLPNGVMEDVAHGRLTFSQARELLALENPEHSVALARELQLKPMTLDQLVLRVRELNQDPDLPGEEPKVGVAKWVDPNIRAAQMEMESILGMRVRIKDRNGRGKIVIEYGSVDDYARVVELLREKE